jgi:glutathione synthase/RimK-type ligase-like ATP-grasp enzyme
LTTERSIAFLTSEELAELTADDRLAVDALAQRGIRTHAAVWTDPLLDVSAFDAVVIRSTWDWHRDARAFASLLESMERTTRVFNARAHEWLDKRYLAKLAARGVRTVPMEVARDADELEQTLEECNDTRVVLKPATAAGAKRTASIDAGDRAAARDAAAPIFETGDAVIVQRFVEAIVADGEWSLVFFDHAFSHALKKRPARGDFRVQEEFGGSVTPETPPRDVIEMASVALEASGREFLYARVDGVMSAPHGGFCVTELEVVEPELFFRVDAASAVRFADALARRLARAE